MNWNNQLLGQFIQVNEIKNLAAKRAVANKMAARVKDGEIVGVGSGSSALLALVAIAERIKAEELKVKVIPTSYEINMASQHLGLMITDLLSDRPDWCFDGADEVDPNHSLNKGRGGAMFREKLVMSSCEERYILVDDSKMVQRLGTNFPIPIEVHQAGLSYVTAALKALGAKQMNIRAAKGKDGPVITESGCVILDVRFEVVFDGLEKAIKVITGVLDSGLFQGYKPNILSV